MKDSYSKPFFDKVVAEVKARGWSEVKFAQSCGMSPGHFGAIKYGRVSMTFYTMERVCKGLGKDPKEFL